MKILIQVKCTVRQTRLFIKAVLAEQVLVKGRQEISVPLQQVWCWGMWRVLSWALWAGKAPSGRDGTRGLQERLQVTWKNTCDLPVIFVTWPVMGGSHCVRNKQQREYENMCWETLNRFRIWTQQSHIRAGGVGGFPEQAGNSWESGYLIPWGKRRASPPVLPPMRS